MADVYRWIPFLELDSPSLSVSGTTPVHFQVDFPTSAWFSSYTILASATGTGPTTQGGIEIPLTPDALFSRMLGGWMPSILHGGRGVLNVLGNAQATLDAHPGLAPAIGRTIHFAAISFDPASMTGRLSSVAAPLLIVP